MGLWEFLLNNKNLNFITWLSTFNIHFEESVTEVYSDLLQTSKMEFLEKLLKASNYFREKLHVRCLPGPEHASVLYSNPPVFTKFTSETLGRFLPFTCRSLFLVSCSTFRNPLLTPPSRYLGRRKTRIQKKNHIFNIKLHCVQSRV